MVEANVNTDELRLAQEWGHPGPEDGTFPKAGFAEKDCQRFLANDSSEFGDFAFTAEEERMICLGKADEAWPRVFAIQMEIG